MTPATTTPQTSATAAPEATVDTGGFSWASGGACFAAPDVSAPLQMLADAQPAPLTISPEIAQQAMTFDPSSKYFAKPQDWHWG